MNIIYDYQAFSLQEHGGVSRYLCEIASLCNMSEDISTKIVAPLYINNYLHTMRGLPRYGIKIRKIPRTHRLVQHLNAFLYKRYLKQHQFNIIHQTYYSPINRRLTSKPIILTIYDMIQEKYPQYFKSPEIILKKKRESVNQADHIICISENTRNDLVEILGVNKEKTSVIHLGFSSSIKKNANSNNTIYDDYILFVGKRSGHKNFNALLEAYSGSVLSKDRIKIVCFGGGNFSKHELETLKQYGVPRDLVIQVSGNDEVLSSLYSNAIAFVYPSLYEGFGIPPLEAMANSCPVICSNTSSLPEVVADAAETFDPENIDEITESLDKVYPSHEYRQSLILKGSQRYKQFTWKECADKTGQIYQMFGA